MAAYYLDEADSRGVPLSMIVVAGDRGNGDCELVFEDPTDLIHELEQSWCASKRARYVGRLRAVRQQVEQFRNRHWRKRRSG